jgi:hypothetical protein
MIGCEDKVWGEVMCEKQKNLSEKLQLGMYTEEPLLRWLKDFLRSAAP